MDVAYNEIKMETIPLWNTDAPGTKGRANEEEVVNERVRKVHQPALTIHLPPGELATGTGILVCPGGGYHHLAINKEGHQIANWLNTLGIAAFVLKYRLDRAEALQDVQRAMRVIRHGASQWAVEPDQLGVMGFSAGGHLIVNLVLNSDEGHSDGKDPIEQHSCHPSFMVPVYVYIKDLDVETELPTNAPPAFLVGATDDTTTPPENSLRLYSALIKHNIAAELHLYERGKHGFGLGKNKGPVSSWTIHCEAWLKQNHLLDLAE